MNPYGTGGFSPLLGRFSRFKTVDLVNPFHWKRFTGLIRRVTPPINRFPSIVKWLWHVAKIRSRHRVSLQSHNIFAFGFSAQILKNGALKLLFGLKNQRSASNLRVYFFGFSQNSL